MNTKECDKKWYIKSLLEDNPIDLKGEIENLKNTSGAKFFDKNQQEVFPEKDFYLSTEVDKFNFVLKLEKDNETGLDYIRELKVMWWLRENKRSQLWNKIIMR